jgi:hypothetical protein
LQLAKPGLYTLHPSREQVSDPDFTMRWIIYKRGYWSRLRHRERMERRRKRRAEKRCDR